MNEKEIRAMFKFLAGFFICAWLLVCGLLYWASQ